MNRIGLSIGLSTSLLFLWLAVKDINFEYLSGIFSGANLWFSIPLLAFFCLFYLLKAFRWRAILSTTIEIDTLSLLGPILVGAAGNNLMPAHLGEFARAFCLGNQYQLPKSLVFASLIAERFLDIIAVLLILLIGVLFDASAKSYEYVIAFLLFSISLIFLIIMLLHRYPEKIIKILDYLLKHVSVNTRSRIIEQVMPMQQGLSAIVMPLLFTRLIIISIVKWLCMVLVIQSSFAAFSISVPFQAAIFVLALIVAALILPTGPGFFGVIQYCFVLGLSTYDIDATVAFGTSVFYHALIWSAATISGIAVLRRYDLSLALISSRRNNFKGPPIRRNSK